MKKVLFALIFTPVAALAKPAITMPTLRFDSGNLIASVSVKEDCPKFAKFKLADPDFHGSNVVASVVNVTTVWKEETKGQCTTTLAASAVSGILKDGARLVASVAINLEENTRTDSISVLHVCNGGNCALVDPATVTAKSNPVSALASKVTGWLKGMPQQDPAKTAEGCASVDQCPNSNPGTVGDTIRSR